jgi:hypothetical protein
MIEFIVKKIIHSGTNFIRHWYGERTLWFWSQVSDLIRFLDRRLAVFINLKLFFTPLYGDNTVTGRFFGPIFRASRVVGGLLVYGLICFGALGLWLGYSTLLPYLIFKMIS